MSLNIFPYGPMQNDMTPIKSKSYTAADIKRMSLITCKYCGIKLRDENNDVCKRTKCVDTAADEMAKARDSEN